MAVSNDGMNGVGGIERGRRGGPNVGSAGGLSIRGGRQHSKTWWGRAHT